MTLVYKILWVDDHKAFFKNHRNYIKEHLEEKGFDVNITEYTSFQEFQENGNTQLQQKEYDLFLIDLNLDHGNTGDQIISEIRTNHVLTDVIFYSTQLRDVKQKIIDNVIEGVYITNRSDFEDKVTDVIDVTIRKVQDVNNLRGLIMAEVAELDRLKKEIVKKYTLNNKDHDNLKKYVKEYIFSKIKKDIEDYDFLIKDDDSYKNMELDQLIENLIYDSYRKARTVYRIKRLEPNCSSIPFVFDEYYKDVIKKRNVFAHEEESTRKDGTKFLTYKNGDLLEFDEEHCIKIRKDIKKYKQILKNIEKVL